MTPESIRIERASYFEMEINPHPGLFIDIEGLDGSGSSTQTKLLSAALIDEGLAVYATKEPTDNVIGGFIRGALTKVIDIPPSSLQLLFAADRGHHLARKLTPILQGRNVAITDRYSWSTVAFGAVSEGRQWLLELNRHFFLPDISIFVQVRPVVCLKRIGEGRLGYELFEEEEKLKRVAKTYRWLAKKFPEIITVVDGERKPKRVLEDILKRVRCHSKFEELKGGGK